MMIPESIAGHIDMWRTDIRTSNISSVDRDIKNAVSHHENIVQFIEYDQSVQSLLQSAVEKSQTYYRSASIFQVGDETLKEAAFEAVDAAASALEYAKPNQFARSLGLDWFPKQRE